MLQTNRLSVFEHFVGLAPKELKLKRECTSISANFPLYECKHFVKPLIIKPLIFQILTELNFVLAIKKVC